MLDLLEMMRSVSPETNPSALVYAKTHSGSPAQPVLVTRHRFDFNPPLNPGQVMELFGHTGSFESTLRLKADVLEITASTVAGTGILTWWSDPIRRGPEYLNGISPEKRRSGGGDPGHDPLPGKRMTDKDDPSVGGTSDTSAASGNVADLKFEHLSAFGARHGAKTSGGACCRPVLIGVENVPRSQGEKATKASGPAGPRW